MKEFEQIDVIDVFKENTTSPVEKALKIKLAYDNAKTIDEKYDYIVKTMAIQATAAMKGQKVTDEESGMIENLQNEFIRTYIDQGTEKTRIQAIGAMAKNGTEYNLKLYDDRNKEMQRLSDQDAGLKERKAFYLAKSSADNQSVIASHVGFSGMIQAAFNSCKAAKEESVLGYELSEETTLAEFAQMVGCTEQEAGAIYDHYSAAPETKVFSIVAKELLEKAPNLNQQTEDFKNKVFDSIKDHIVFQKYILWSKRERDKGIQERNFNEEQEKDFQTVEERASGEASEKGFGDWDSFENGKLVRNHDDWLKNEGIPYIAQNNKEKYNSFVNEYSEKYVAPAEPLFERHKMIDVEPDVSPEERAERAKYIYNNLETIEEKFSFILDFQADNLACQELGLTEHWDKGSGAFISLLNDFCEKYVTYATPEVQAEVLRLVGKATGKNAIDTFSARKEAKSLLDPDDEYIDKKANYLARMSAEGSVYTSALSDMIFLIDSSIQKSNTFWNSIKSDIKIDKNTTLEEVADYVDGGFDELAEGFKAEYQIANASPDAKYFDVIKAKRLALGAENSSDDVIMNEARTDIINAMSTAIKRNAISNVVAENDLSKEDREEIKEIISTNGKEVSKSKIHEWIDKEAGPIVSEKSFTANTKIRKGFLDKYSDKNLAYKTTENQLKNNHELLENGFDILGGNSHEKAQKIASIYDGLTTIEDKIRFLAETSNYLTLYKSVNRYGVTKNVQDVMNTLVTEFKDEYIKNGTKEDQKKVFDALSKLETEHNLGIYYDVNKNLESFKDGNPELFDDKAYYIARNNPVKEGFISELNKLSKDISNEYKENDDAIETALSGIQIDKIVTMSDFLKTAGYTEQEISVYMSENDVSQDITVNDYYGKKIMDANPDVDPDSELFKDGLLNIKKQQFLEERLKLWKKRGRSNVLKANGLNEEQKKSFEKIEKKNQKKAPSDDIKEWLDVEGQRICRINNINSRRALLASYKNNYIDKEQARTLAFNAAKNHKDRMKHSTAGAYKKLFEKDPQTGEYSYGVLTDQELADLKNDMNVGIGDEIRDELTKVGFAAFTEADKAIIANAQPNLREATQLSIFTLWALGTQDSVDMTNFARIYQNRDLVRKYVEFCKNNPTVEATSEDQLKKSIKSWTDMFLKATEKVKTYKFPKIKYNDPEVLKEQLFELARLNAMCVDYLQERERTYKNQLGLDGLSIAETTMGENKYNETLLTWSQLQSTLAYFNSSYMLPINEKATENLLFRLTDKVVNKELCDQVLGKVAGKTVEEALSSIGARRFYGTVEANYYNETTDFGSNKLTGRFEGLGYIDRKDIVKFANGKDKKPFTKLFNSITEKASNDAVQNFNTLTYNKLNGGMSTLDLSELKPLLDDLPDKVENVVEFLKDTKNKVGEKNLTKSALITTALGGFFPEDYRMLITFAGIKTLDAFTIDGKSPRQLWEAKYRKVPDELKENCFKLEILKSIVSGKHDVRMKVIGLGADNKVRVVGETTISPNANRVYELKQNIAIYKSGLKSMASELEAIQNTLLSTHQTKDPKKLPQEIGEVGSDLFREMEVSLSNAIDALKDDKVKSSEIRNKIEAYQKASAKYYKARTNLIFKKDDIGQVRLDTSKLGADTASELLMTFDNLRVGLDTDILAGDAGTTRDESIYYLQDTIKNFESKKKAGAYNNGAKDIPQNGIDKLAEDAREKAKYQLKAKGVLAEGIKGFGLDFDKIIRADSKLTDPAEAAAALFIDNVMKEITSDRASIQTFENLESKIKERFQNGSAKKEINNLSKNPVFRSFIKENGGFNLQSWKKLEDRTDFAIDNMKKQLREISDGRNEFDYSKYINKMANGDERTLNQRYEKLSDIVAKQILTDPANRVVVQAIEAGKMDYMKDVVVSIGKALKKNEYLKDTASVKLVDDISSGALKKAMISNIIKSTQKKAEVVNKKAKEVEKTTGPRR